MKSPQTLISFLASAALLAATNLNAATTDPVGYVSVDVNADADRRIGVPLHQNPAITASVSAVSATTLTTSATVPDVTTEAHYLWITSGTLLGKWYEVTASTSNTLTVTEDLEAAGLSASDSFKVVPFWSLSTLLPNGGNLPQSPNPFSPIAFVQLNDVTLVGTDFVPGFSYFYHDGSQVPEGWYQFGNLGAGAQNDVIISPESFISIRNDTASPLTLVVAGTVPDTTIAIDVVQRLAGDQDNQIANPFPAGVTLSTSDLVTDGIITPSPNPFAPGDLLLVYESVPTINDPVADKSFFYHDGSQAPEGWYQFGNLGAGSQDDYELPSAGAIVVRKKAGADTVVSWTPSTPYTL